MAVRNRVQWERRSSSFPMKRNARSRAPVSLRVDIVSDSCVETAHNRLDGTLHRLPFAFTRGFNRRIEIVWRDHLDRGKRSILIHQRLIGDLIGEDGSNGDGCIFIHIQYEPGSCIRWKRNSAVRLSSPSEILRDLGITGHVQIFCHTGADCARFQRGNGVPSAITGATCILRDGPWSGLIVIEEGIVHVCLEHRRPKPKRHSPSVAQPHRTTRRWPEVLVAMYSPPYWDNSGRDSV